MKDKIIAYGTIILFFLVVFLLMLVSDGMFGEKIKSILGILILVFSIVIVLIIAIINIYYKFKK